MSQILRKLFDIREGEGLRAFLMFLYIYLLIASLINCQTGSKFSLSDNFRSRETSIRFYSSSGYFSNIYLFLFEIFP